MKSRLFLIVAVAAGYTTFAQGRIIFTNRNIPTANGTPGGNGNGTYHVPIWSERVGNGAGDLPGGVTVGLFNVSAPDNAAPLATTLLRVGANSQFFVTTAQAVDIPGSEAGTRPILIVRGWQGSGGFAAAKNGGLQYFESSFQTRPLGGLTPDFGLPLTNPGMTGWGPEDGTGFIMVPEPSAIALTILGVSSLVLRRRK